MEIMPSEYQHIDLSRDEKIFVRNIIANDCYGYLLLNSNPAMQINESMHILICSDGILFLKFFNKMDNVLLFHQIMTSYYENVYPNICEILSKKLITNKSLVDKNEKLRFPINILCVFPLIKREDIRIGENSEIEKFLSNNCLFKDDLQNIRSGLDRILDHFFSYPISEVSSEKLIINDSNLNSILQRISPEYVTIRLTSINDSETTPGVNNDLLVITKDDIAVKAFRLDPEQINIANKMAKGEQLILACAGSGKSVLLISKCFKAAMMNPDKKFLITCYNKNLCSLYQWFIDRAGLRAKNVKCVTFHLLCKELLNEIGFSTDGLKPDKFAEYAISRMNQGKIKQKFYGIFIDEVQQFDTEWYKFCFNLLENKSSSEHIFVICGDKTQKLANLQKHGRAPWNAGEGYPNYRGGNKSIRIEKNYRNCIEINEYINNFVSNARNYLLSVQSDVEIDPDEFLRGKSFFHGQGTTIKHLVNKSNRGEAKSVLASIKQLHDIYKIPYDEIAIIMYNRSFSHHFAGWFDNKYNIEKSLIDLLNLQDIPYSTMYSTPNAIGTSYGSGDGIRLIGVQTVLGLDFKAAIVCGLVPLGYYYGTKNPNWSYLKQNEAYFQETLMHTHDIIRSLYVACTRAKEYLHIILPETGETSVYMKMLEDAYLMYEEAKNE